MEKLKKHIRDNLALYVVGLNVVACSALAIVIHKAATPSESRYPFGTNLNDAGLLTIKNDDRLNLLAAAIKARNEK